MKKSILYPALALLLTATGGCTDSFLTDRWLYRQFLDD